MKHAATVKDCYFCCQTPALHFSCFVISLTLLWTIRAVCCLQRIASSYDNWHNWMRNRCYSNCSCLYCTSWTHLPQGDTVVILNTFTYCQQIHKCLLFWFPWLSFTSLLFCWPHGIMLNDKILQIVMAWSVKLISGTIQMGMITSHWWPMCAFWGNGCWSLSYISDFDIQNK